MKNSNSGTRNLGLLAGGNWIIDLVKMIDVYPAPEQLANIRSQSEGTGGAPYNVLVGLARAGAPFPLYAAGSVGNDALGRDIIANCRRHKIGVKNLTATEKAPTSYTDVMTEMGTGRRTFFHARGANALWDGSDIDFKKLKPRIFHMGYLLLLDALDQSDPQFGTRAAKLLAKAQMAGVKTSVDVVSEDSDRFARIVNPALAHVDYCILNEIEAGKTTGFKTRQDNGAIDPTALKHAAGALLQSGVRELVVIHFPEGAFARTRMGEDAWQPSLDLPKGYVGGTAGAGDAFCGGVLWGLHEGWDIRKCLLTGICLATASLSKSTCTDGIKSLRHAMTLARKFGFSNPLVAD